MAEKRCVYKCGAWNCGSYQFNLYKDDIDQGDLCDVHYWQTKAQPEVDCPRCGHVCSQRTEQEPVAYYHPHKGFHWAKPTHISTPTVVDVPPMPLYAAPPAAQPPPEWVGLTEEELQFYRKKYSKLVNAGYDKVTDTNLVAKTFDSTGFYKEVSTVLKERNT